MEALDLEQDEVGEEGAVCTSAFGVSPSLAWALGLGALAYPASHLQATARSLARRALSGQAGNRDVQHSSMLTCDRHMERSCARTTLKHSQPQFFLFLWSRLQYLVARPESGRHMPAG